MTKPQRARIITLLWLLVALISFLTIGAVRHRQAYLTRGIPEGLPEPMVEGGVRLGVNVALTQYDNEALRTNLSNIKATGIDYVKQSFYFKEDYDWKESDRIIIATADSGLVMIPLLDGDPDEQFEPPENPTAFADWAGEFAARYANHFRAYIIWDEPNLASHWGNKAVNPAEYAALLTAASQAVRSADPDAVIVAAPLAPTTEMGPSNLSDPTFLEQLYEAGAAPAFDVAAGKPYGFNSGPDDRAVDLGTLNFSRIILLREVIERHGDRKAIWAGNWGWNSLPADWHGEPSIWDQTSEAEQASRTIAAITRARQEWPWMGVMFLENWEPAGPDDDARWGFSIAGKETAAAIQSYRNQAAGGQGDERVAFPGFHLARQDDPAQTFSGGWRFSPEYGADISQTGDSVSLRFWGTEVSLRVRRADYRARLYVTVDGQPANALPKDENGRMLVLTAPSPTEEFVSIERVASDLEPGIHTLNVVASRGWDQWALSGFSVAYRPADSAYKWSLAGLWAVSLLAIVLSFRAGRQAEWVALAQKLARIYAGLNEKQQLALTATGAIIVALAGWFTWGSQAAGLYRRLGEPGQLALTVAAASIFYVTPIFLVYVGALVLLLVVITFRPAWGVALVAATIPFYVVPKSMLGYRFSPVEVFTLVTLLAFFLSRIPALGQDLRGKVMNLRFSSLFGKLQRADLAVLGFVLAATISLLFTERLDVATNEWRVVILEPSLFYLLLRASRLSEREMWVVLDAFVLGGILVAGYGLWQYAAGENLITAEGGLMRLRSIYGSPNNVGLYLGRVLPLLGAMALMGTSLNGRRRWMYALALLPVGLAIMLSFSRGALLLGVPVAAMYIFWRWQSAAGRRTWPWLVAFAGLSVIAVALVLQTDGLSGRFDLRGATSVFRLNLWRASINMFEDHPLFGVGLDNFLYAYRGRYILDAAWAEPNLSHPHNILLDFATRLGVVGLLAGAWMIWLLVRLLRQVHKSVSATWMPVAVGFGGILADMLAHGLVDHSFFLVDLAYAFYLVLGAAVWLSLNQQSVERESIA